MARKQKPQRQPATTDEGRESQLVSLAIDLAEKQLSDGSATAQVITHYLKVGSTREKLEQERLHRENLLLDSKVEMMASAKRVEELYESALRAMRDYAGQLPEEDDGYDE
jgi:hypothetical protein